MVWGAPERLVCIQDMVSAIGLCKLLEFLLCSRKETLQPVVPTREAG